MERRLHQFGMIGLGVMGRNLVLNIAEHGFSVIGYDKDKAMVARLNQEAGGKQIHGVDSLEEFL
ncbi:MAG: NAD(P)-binding domain-containing protein, partial [Anaerolineales bacterium]